MAPKFRFFSVVNGAVKVASSLFPFAGNYPGSSHVEGLGRNKRILAHAAGVLTKYVSYVLGFDVCFDGIVVVPMTLLI